MTVSAICPPVVRFPRSLSLSLLLILIHLLFLSPRSFFFSSRRLTWRVPCVILLCDVPCLIRCCLCVRPRLHGILVYRRGANRCFESRSRGHRLHHQGAIAQTVFAVCSCSCFVLFRLFHVLILFVVAQRSFQLAGRNMKFKFHLVAMAASWLFGLCFCTRLSLSLSLSALVPNLLTHRGLCWFPQRFITMRASLWATTRASTAASGSALLLYPLSVSLPTFSLICFPVCLSLSVSVCVQRTYTPAMAVPIFIVFAVCLVSISVIYSQSFVDIRHSTLLHAFVRFAAPLIAFALVVFSLIFSRGCLLVLFVCSFNNGRASASASPH